MDIKLVNQLCYKTKKQLDVINKCRRIRDMLEKI